MVALVFYSFRIMVGIGFIFLGLMLWSVLQWIRGKLADSNISQQKWLMRAWIFNAPLGYIAVESGWIVREVGRQPWTVYGEIRTSEAASNLPPGDVLASLIGFSAVYLVLLVSALYFGSRILREGPNFDLPVPGEENQETINTSQAQHLPDSRPAESR
jgi:cytochrome d ubiquinol oxidase subunit I